MVTRLQPILPNFEPRALVPLSVFPPSMPLVRIYFPRIALWLRRFLLPRERWSLL